MPSTQPRHCWLVPRPQMPVTYTHIHNLSLQHAAQQEHHLCFVNQAMSTVRFCGTQTVRANRNRSGNENLRRQRPKMTLYSRQQSLPKSCTSWCLVSSKGLDNMVGDRVTLLVACLVAVTQTGDRLLPVLACLLWASSEAGQSSACMHSASSVPILSTCSTRVSMLVTTVAHHIVIIYRGSSRCQVPIVCVLT